MACFAAACFAFSAFVAAACFAFSASKSLRVGPTTPPPPPPDIVSPVLLKCSTSVPGLTGPTNFLGTVVTPPTTVDPDGGAGPIVAISH